MSIMECLTQEETKNKSTAVKYLLQRKKVLSNTRAGHNFPTDHQNSTSLILFNQCKDFNIRRSPLLLHNWMLFYYISFYWFIVITRSWLFSKQIISHQGLEVRNSWKNIVEFKKIMVRETEKNFPHICPISCLS